MSDHTVIEGDRIKATIARRMRGIMLIASIDRQKLAAATGISETRIARVLKCSSDLAAHELVMVARALGVPVGVLCGEEGKEPGRR